MNTEVQKLERVTGLSAFSDPAMFQQAQQMAKALAASSIVPSEYQNNLPNCLVALNLAWRVKQDPFAVMQSLDVIQGKPAWKSTYIIAAINTSDQFDKLRFNIEGQGDQMKCYAHAKEVATGEILKGSVVSIAMAKSEGWYDRKGSKWKTMPEQMLQYRAASFFAKLHCPELLNGMHSSDEVSDFVTQGKTEEASYTEMKDETSALNSKFSQPAGQVAEAIPPITEGADMDQPIM